MRALLVSCLSVCGWFSVFGQDVNNMSRMPKYDVRYDYLDIDGILDSKRLVRNYVDCLINQKPCTPEGKALKRILPEALRTKCVRCTERQKKTAVKVIRRLKYEYPDEWAKLASRWDPTGDFTRFFEEFLAKDQFNTIVTASNEPVGTVSMPPRQYPPQRSTPSQVVVVTPTPPPPSMQPSPSRPPSMADGSSSITPLVLNRFGDDGELIMEGAPSSMVPRPMTNPTMRPSASSIRPVMNTRPLETMPTRIPMRPPNNMPPPYTTAITLIDQIGFKIMRTTELVTDILRNTVRAVVSG